MPHSSRYTIQQKKGQGAYADVWQAQDEKLGRRVAIKFFRHSAADLDAVRDHARALAKVPPHDNVVVVYGMDEVEGPGGTIDEALIMEWIDGRTLEQRLSEGRLSRAEATQILSGIVDGLIAIHQAGVAHRDLHPGNIMLTKRGRAKIIDILSFGTQHWHPEQLLHDQVGDKQRMLDIATSVMHRSDLDPVLPGKLRQLVRADDDLLILKTSIVEIIAEAEVRPAQVLTAARPDIGVAVRSITTFGPPNPGIVLLQISVQNRSPVPFYLSGVLLELGTDRLLYAQHDAVEPNRTPHNVVVESGNSWEYTVNPRELAGGLRHAKDLGSVLVTDKVGREWRSDANETQRALLQCLRGDKVALPLEPKPPSGKMATTILNTVTFGFMAGGGPVDGLRLRLLLGEKHTRDEVNSALDECCPLWFIRNGRRPRDNYQLTRRGLEASEFSSGVGAFFDSFLPFYKVGISRDFLAFRIDYAEVSKAPGLGTFSAPFMKSALTLYGIIGSGGSSGDPCETFSYEPSAKFLETLLDCSDYADLIALSDRLDGV